jgi:hypothetical protein
LALRRLTCSRPCKRELFCLAFFVVSSRLIHVLGFRRRWGKAEAKRQDKSDKPENLAKILEDIIPLIRFPTMEVGEIAGVVSTRFVAPACPSLSSV